MSKIYFPTNSELENAVLQALSELNGIATTKEINQKVIDILKLPQEVVELEDESGLGTKLNYRLRWARTVLKQKNKITNVKKGTWQLNA